MAKKKKRNKDSNAYKTSEMGMKRERQKRNKLVKKEEVKTYVRVIHHTYLYTEAILFARI